MFCTLEGYLKAAARKAGSELPENYKKILSSYYSSLQKDQDSALYNANIYFKAYVTPINVSPNLNASSRKDFDIEFDEYWAERILFYPTPELFEAFCLTAGHEITHKAGEYREAGLNLRKRRMANWVREVRADFGGKALMHNHDRSRTVKTMQYKQSLNRSSWLLRKLNKYQHSHPPMERRITYLKDFNFDEKLIREIAKDAKCHNEEYIQMLCNFYFVDQTSAFN